MHDLLNAPWLPLAVLVVAVGASLAALMAGAHRFARRRQREGAWNAEGPIHASEPPPDWGVIPAYGVRRPEIETEPGDVEHSDDSDERGDAHRD